MKTVKLFLWPTCMALNIIWIDVQLAVAAWIALFSIMDTIQEAAKSSDHRSK